MRSPSELTRAIAIAALPWAQACAPVSEPANIVTLSELPPAAAIAPSKEELVTVPVLLGDLGCTWMTNTVVSAEPIRLCDRAGNHCFVEAADNPLQWRLVTVAMSQGHEPSFLIQLTYGGMTMQGFTQSPPRLFPQAPVVFGGAWIAAQVVAVEGGAGHLRAKAIDTDRVLASELSDKTLGCDEVAPSPQWWSQSEELPLIKSSTPAIEMELADGDTPFFDAFGAEVARVRLADEAVIDAFQSNGSKRLARLRTESGAIFGWVPAQRLKPIRRPAPRPPKPSLDPVTTTPDPGSGMQCPWPLRLYARVPDRAGAVVLDIGVIEDRATFTVVGPIGRDLVEVALRHEIATTEGTRKPAIGLRLVAGAKLAVKTTALTTCSRER